MIAYAADVIVYLGLILKFNALQSIMTLSSPAFCVTPNGPTSTRLSSGIC